MKRFFVFVVLIFAIGFTEVAYAQLVKDSWTLGFGFTYPQLISINSNPRHANYGGYISGQRNFSEHVTLRLKASYLQMKSEFIDANSIMQQNNTNGIVGNADLLYYLVPCEPVSPYIFAGAGAFYRWISNVNNAVQYDNDVVAQWGMGFGAEVALNDSWKLVGEFGYHITNNSELEGVKGAGELNAHDTYMGVSVGLQYFLEKGEPSKYCQLYSGIAPEMKDLTDYSKIEDMIVKHIPKEVTKEVVVEKMVKPSVAEKWVLVGNNFEFNKATLTAESYPMLYDAAKTLLKNPDAKVEIHGYTDNIGTEAYNKKLSERRAETVKDYLVSKGVAASRLTLFAEGESNPVSDNKTAEGRAMNRRIEFKIQ